MSLRGIIVFEKFPAEEFAQSVDFATVLLTGETIQTAAVSARNYTTGVDATAAVLSGSPTISTTKINYNVRAGTPGESYLLSVRATTNQAHVYEQWIDMRVPKDTK